MKKKKRKGGKLYTFFYYIPTARWKIPSRTPSTRFLSQISCRPLKNPTLRGCDRFQSRVRFRSKDLVILAESCQTSVTIKTASKQPGWNFFKRSKKFCSGPHLRGHLLQRGTRSIISLVDDQSPKL